MAGYTIKTEWYPNLAEMIPVMITGSVIKKVKQLEKLGLIEIQIYREKGEGPTKVVIMMDFGYSSAYRIESVDCNDEVVILSVVEEVIDDCLGKKGIIFFKKANKYQIVSIEDAEKRNQELLNAGIFDEELEEALEQAKYHDIKKFGIKLRTITHVEAADYELLMHGEVYSYDKAELHFYDGRYYALVYRGYRNPENCYGKRIYKLVMIKELKQSQEMKLF